MPIQMRAGGCSDCSRVTYEQRDEREEDARKCDVDDVVVRLALQMKHKEQLRIQDTGSQAERDLLSHRLSTRQMPHACNECSTLHSVTRYIGLLRSHPTPLSSPFHQWRRQPWDTGARPPRDFQQFYF